jgi:hypothetical protein
MEQESTKTSSFIQKTSLIKLRLKAMRSGVWFKVLNRIDRILVNLTIQVANNNVCSITLITQLLFVTNKLERLLCTSLLKSIKKVGFQIANKFSVFAQSWGNKVAKAWANEFEFARYLAVMKINSEYNNGLV